LDEARVLLYRQRDFLMTALESNSFVSKYALLQHFPMLNTFVIAQLMACVSFRQLGDERLQEDILSHFQRNYPLTDQGRLRSFLQILHTPQFNSFLPTSTSTQSAAEATRYVEGGEDKSRELEQEIKKLREDYLTIELLLKSSAAGGEDAAKQQMEEQSEKELLHIRQQVSALEVEVNKPSLTVGHADGPYCSLCTVLFALGNDKPTDYDVHDPIQLLSHSDRHIHKFVRNRRTGENTSVYVCWETCYNRIASLQTGKKNRLKGGEPVNELVMLGYLGEIAEAFWRKAAIDHAKKGAAAAAAAKEKEKESGGIGGGGGGGQCSMDEQVQHEEGNSAADFISPFAPLDSRASALGFTSVLKTLDRNSRHNRGHQDAVAEGDDEEEPHRLEDIAFPAPPNKECQHALNRLLRFTMPYRLIVPPIAIEHQEQTAEDEIVDFESLFPSGGEEKKVYMLFSCSRDTAGTVVPASLANRRTAAHDALVRVRENLTIHEGVPPGNISYAPRYYHSVGQATSNNNTNGCDAGSSPYTTMVTDMRHFVAGGPNRIALVVLSHGSAMGANPQHHLQRKSHHRNFTTHCLCL